MMDRVLVTGGGGFVGRAVVPALSLARYDVRQASSNPRAGALALGAFGRETRWRPVVEGCEAVVHLAARVHARGAADDSAAFTTTNRDATLRLAEEAARAGVRRFVFLSSIKVNGEGRDSPYSEADVPAPEGPYALSKYEAEQGLRDIAARSGLEVVILRPPLVYGPGARGNVRQLMQLVAAGVPLPLRSLRNRRSLIGLANLAAAIRLTLEHPLAAGRTYLLSDQHDVSTPELVTVLARALGQPPRLVPFPVGALELASSLLGQRQRFRQLAGSLVVDSSAISRELGWRPVRSMAAELAEAAAWFHRQQPR